MSNKLTLAKCESRGNLIDTSLKQSYLIQFYPPVVENGKVVLCEKGIIEIVAPSSNGEDVVKSYRMVDPSQEYLLILDLLKLYFFHKNFKGELNEFTLNAFLNKLLKDAKNEGIKVREGVYDRGV